jgi:hypothetical protein
MIAAVEYGQHQGTRQRHPQSYNVRDTEMWKMIKAGDNRVQKVGLGQDLSKVVTAQYMSEELPLDDAIRYGVVPYSLLDDAPHLTAPHRITLHRTMLLGPIFTLHHATTLVWPAHTETRRDRI